MKNLNFIEYLEKSLPDSYVNNIKCEYYSEDNFNHVVKKYKSHKFSLLHLNIRSINKHKGNLLCLMKSMDIGFHIIGLTEIGPKNIETSSAFFRDNHEFYFDPPSSSKGGAALMINHNLIDVNKHTDRSDLKLTSTQGIAEIENVWIELQHPQYKQPIIVGVIYRHPGGNLNTFNERLAITLDKISKENKLCYICGDINVNGFSINSTDTASFFDLILSENYIPQITLPTRITDTSATLIDHIFMKSDIRNIEDTNLSGNIFTDISDHLPNFLLVGLNNDNCTSRDRPLIRIYGEKNMNKFKQQLQDNKVINELLMESDCEKAYDTLYKHYIEIYNSCFPLKRLSRKRSKDKKWITSGLLKCIREKKIDYTKNNFLIQLNTIRADTKIIAIFYMP